MKDEIKEILEFDFQSQGERIEINEYERDILKDYITNLQDLKHFTTIEIYCELEKRLKDMANMIDELSSKCYDLEEENKRLKELCDKYEEEHSTAFNLWKTNIIENVPALSDMQEQLEDYKQRNEKAIEKLESIRIFGLRSGKTLFSTLINESIDILKGDKDE